MVLTPEVVPQVFDLNWNAWISGNFVDISIPFKLAGDFQSLLAGCDEIPCFSSAFHVCKIGSHDPLVRSGVVKKH
jgi:hypothetical protein